MRLEARIAHQQMLRRRAEHVGRVLGRIDLVLHRDLEVRVDFLEERGELAVRSIAQRYERGLDEQRRRGIHRQIHQLSEQHAVQIVPMLQQQAAKPLESALMQEIEHHIGIYASVLASNATANDVGDRARRADADLPAPALLDLHERVESVGQLEKLGVFGVIGEQNGGRADRGGHHVRVGTRKTIDNADNAVAGPHAILPFTLSHQPHLALRALPTARLNTLQTIQNLLLVAEMNHPKEQLHAVQIAHFPAIRAVHVAQIHQNPHQIQTQLPHRRIRRRNRLRRAPRGKRHHTVLR